MKYFFDLESASSGKVRAGYDSLLALTHFKEMGMGNDRYQLVDIDNGDKIITAAEAVKGVKGTWAPDGN